MEPTGKPNHTVLVDKRSCSGALIVEKFLLCFSLRAGTFFICWWTCLYSLCLPIMLIAFYAEMVELDLVLIFLSIPTLILLKGIFISATTLCHFPIPNEEYNIKSISAKSLFRLAVYNGIMSVLSLVIFMIFWILSLTLFTMNPKPIDIWPTILLVTILSGLHVHFTAVVYSYYLSIPKTNENGNLLNSNHVNLVTVNQDVASTVTFIDPTLPTYSECMLKPLKYLPLVHQ